MRQDDDDDDAPVAFLAPARRRSPNSAAELGGFGSRRLVWSTEPTIPKPQAARASRSTRSTIVAYDVLEQCSTRTHSPSAAFRIQREARSSHDRQSHRESCSLAHWTGAPHFVVSLGSRPPPVSLPMHSVPSRCFLLPRRRQQHSIAILGAGNNPLYLRNFLASSASGSQSQGQSANAGSEAQSNAALAGELKTNYIAHSVLDIFEERSESCALLVSASCSAIAATCSQCSLSTTTRSCSCACLLACSPAHPNSRRKAADGAVLGPTDDCRGCGGVRVPDEHADQDHRHDTPLRPGRQGHRRRHGESGWVWRSGNPRVGKRLTPTSSSLIALLLDGNRLPSARSARSRSSARSTTSTSPTSRTRSTTCPRRSPSCRDPRRVSRSMRARSAASASKGISSSSLASDRDRTARMKEPCADLMQTPHGARSKAANKPSGHGCSARPTGHRASAPNPAQAPADAAQAASSRSAGRAETTPSPARGNESRQVGREHRARNTTLTEQRAARRRPGQGCPCMSRAG